MLSRSTASDEELSQQALKLHLSSIVVDSEAPVFSSQMMFTPGMNELARQMLLAGKSRSQVKFALGEQLCEEVQRDPAVRTAYLEFWERSGVTCASSSFYDVGIPWHAWDDALRELSTAHKLLAELKGSITAALTAADIRRAHAEGTHAVIHNMQNTDPLGEQLDRLDVLFGLGVRIVQITYNLRNRFGDGCLERRDGGLSRLGVELVERLNELGVLIDVSHCSDQTVLDAVAVSSRPIACTHTSARAISKHARAKSDSVLRTVAESGGYVGILLVPFFILPPTTDIHPDESGDHNATLDVMVDHVIHALNVVGPEAVGIGTDWSKPFQDALRVEGDLDGLASRSQTPGFDWVGWRPGDRYSRSVYTAGFESWDLWPNITTEMLRRGIPEDTISKVIGGNFVRVFEAATS